MQTESMPARQTFVTRLLRRYHRGASGRAEQQGLPTAEQLEYLCNVGLGPIAFHVYGEEFRQSDAESFSVLQGAELTSRVIYGQLADAAVALAGRLRHLGVEPLFLKGISTSYEFYEPPHLRVMADIDILIPSSHVDVVMAEVAVLGYEIRDEQWRLYKTFGHHHLPAARHPVTGVTIEVHTGLFGAAEFYSGETAFQQDRVEAQSIAFDYRGVPVARFKPEFQFIFTVSKWSADEDWAINLTGINDAIHILRKYESTFDWSTMSELLGANPHLAPIITALMHYLEDADIVRMPSELRELLAGADRVVGKRTLGLLTSLLHTFPFNSRSREYGGYTRWRAHSLWLCLSKPGVTDSTLPIALLRGVFRFAAYGRYNPIVFVPFRLKTIAYLVRRRFRGLPRSA